MPTKNKKAQPGKNKKGSGGKENFFQVRFTVETLYWIILLLLIVGLALWVLQISMQTQEIYNQIQLLNQS